MRRTVFWKVAGVLVSVQVATAVLAVLLTALFARSQGLDLVQRSLRLRLNGVAEEIEAEATLTDGALVIPPRLRFDLATRFPDPLYLLDIDGRVVEHLEPDSFFDLAAPSEGSAQEVAFPAGVQEALQDGTLTIHLQDEGPPLALGVTMADASWGVAPLLDRDGLLVGGVLIWPLKATVTEELAGTTQAFRRSLWTVGVLAALAALALGAAFTWGLVRPLRRITRGVEAIGQGDYDTWLAREGTDEFGRLATAVQAMAAQVRRSIDTLEATDRLRRELIANVGHDLRTPLAALQGYLEEAERLQSEDRLPEAAEALRVARRQSEQVATLVRDLFELSQLDGPQAATQLRHDPVPLAELLHDTARSHRRAFQDAALTFETEIPPGLPILEADAMRLLRVFDNLLSNARRHTPDGGTVRLSARRTDGAVQIDVTDTGEGIPPDQQATIFDRYYRGSSARTRGAERTGLGLAICRAIVRAHGGEVTVQSSPGVGSTFTVTLPVEE